MADENVDNRLGTEPLTGEEIARAIEQWGVDYMHNPGYLEWVHRRVSTPRNKKPRKQEAVHTFVPRPFDVV